MYKTEDLLLAQSIKVVFFDVDGVFTDGRLIYSDTTESLKQFNVLDGLGIKLLKSTGIEPVVISGRSGRHVEKRFADLGVRHVNLGVEKKIFVAEKILLEMGLNWDLAAAMGDDWPDLELIGKCCFSCAPPNAHREVLSRVQYVSEKKGGEGAVRDFCDLLITAKGKYDLLLSEALGQYEHQLS